MKVDRTIARMAGKGTDELRHAGRDVGFELPRCRNDVLADFRACAAPLVEHEDLFARGYVTALLDVVRSYQAVTTERRPALVLLTQRNIPDDYEQLTCLFCGARQCDLAAALRGNGRTTTLGLHSCCVGQHATVVGDDRYWPAEEPEAAR